MFSFAKFKVEMILGLVLVLVIGGFVWSYNNKDTQIDKLKETAVVQKVENKSLKQTVAQQEGAAEVNQAVNKEVAVKKNDLTATLDKINADTRAKLDKIPKGPGKYNKPTGDVSTSEKITQQETATEAMQVSQVVIAGMWETYCAAQPNGEGCASPPVSDLSTPEPEHLSIVIDAHQIADIATYV